jgi:hypothetical protein
MASFGRRSFWLFNRLFMIPMFLIGFGPFIGNKFTGYIMLLKTIGRRTGRIHLSPVNYAIHRGNLYCIAGWGHLSDWYRNLILTKEIEVILPSSALFGTVEVVSILEERNIIIRKILQNAGFAGFFEGFNPFTVTDEILAKRTVDMPLLRIHPAGIGNGASDPGGLFWVWIPVSIVLLVLIAFLSLR